MFGNIMKMAGRGAGIVARNPRKVAGIGMGAIGAGYGAYQADPRMGESRLTAAGIGAGIGIAGGIGAVALGRRVPGMFRSARSNVMQGLGRMRSGTEMYGPIKRANASLSSCKQNVANQKAKAFSFFKKNTTLPGNKSYSAQDIDAWNYAKSAMAGPQTPMTPTSYSKNITMERQPAFQRFR